MRFSVIMLAMFLIHWPCQAQWVRVHGNFDPTGVTARCFAPLDGLLFLGTNGVGVYGSNDSGRSWQASNPGVYSGQISSLAVIGSALFAQTESGIFRSADSGLLWTLVSTSGGRALISLGNFLFQLADSVVLESNDSGRTWISAMNGLQKSQFLSILSDGSKLFTTTYDNGISISDDSGRSWRNISNGLPSGPIERCTARDGNLVTCIYQQGGYYSPNSGNTWKSRSGELDSEVYALVLTQNFLFVGLGLSHYQKDCVFASSDFGIHWTAVSEGLPNSVVFVLMPLYDYLFAVTSYGLWRRPLSEMIGSSAVEKHAAAISQGAQVYPNPSSQSTTIAFSTSERSLATVGIVNLLGEQVQCLFSGELEVGEHSFSWDTRKAPAGIYFCEIKTNGRVERLKIMVVQ
jgi:hypothetical protein